MLDKLITRSRAYNIKFNKHKLQCCKTQVKFLGHLFDQNRMTLDPSRIEGIQNQKSPTFIPNFSELTAPLRN